jgi:hypothetical protein
VISGHDRRDRCLGKGPAAEDHIVRITEACIGCRRVDGHGRQGSVKRSTLNHRLSCRAILLSLGSLEACCQIAKKCWSKRNSAARPPSDRHGPRGNRPPETRIILISSVLARCQPTPLHPNRANIVNLPFALPIIRDCSCQGLDSRQPLLCFGLKHASLVIGYLASAHALGDGPPWVSVLVARYAKGCCISVRKAVQESR